MSTRKTAGLLALLVGGGGRSGAERPYRWSFVPKLLFCALALSACGRDGSDGGAEAAKKGFCHGMPDGADCDDQNPCTTSDRCGLGVCLGMPANEDLECDDGDPCTILDACAKGACAGEAVDCSQKDGQCTEGACDSETGSCEALPRDDGVSCDDGAKCTTADACKAGKCEGEPVVCQAPDDEQCVTAVCDTGTGECAYDPASAGSGCDDGDPCTTGDACTGGGECAGEALDCSDLDGDCKEGACDPESGICKVKPFPNGTVCDDGNACTDAEYCVNGSCGNEVLMPDGSICDDGDPCTESDVCGAGSCAGAAKDCSALATSACLSSMCDEETGECEAVPVSDPACICFGAEDGTGCDDGQPCTKGDACKEGLCIAEPLDCSTFDDVCNEGVCEESTGLCVKSPLAAGKPCDDGLRCTANDGCRAGVCEGTPVDCADLDVGCEVGFCNEATGACEQRTASDGAPCDDGNPCTGHDDCDGGVCEGEIDVCAGCYGKDGESACDDGDACTVGTICVFTAEQLVCIGEMKECPDLGLLCKMGVCDPGSGDCVPIPKPDGIPCNDGDPCTVLDACAAGECAGAPKDCGAIAGPCGDGACDPETGVCQVDPFEEGTPCDDGDPCTVDETCSGGLCEGAAKGCGGVAGPCMEGVCDPETGECGVPLEDGTVCDDLDVCTARDKCAGGECVGEEICFCVGKADGTPCDDGNACTTNDACVSDGCKGQPLDCSTLDGPCKVGACEPSTGQCKAKAKTNGSQCDDGLGCTTGDTCQNGACGGKAVDCSHLNGQCGVGKCQGAGQCVLSPATDGTPCDDGEACTGSDACAAGTCEGGVNLCGACLELEAGDACDDGDPCTVDTSCVEMSGLVVCTGRKKDCAGEDDACNVGSCDKGSGDCKKTPRQDGTACDDGDPCTAADGCKAGACEGEAIDMCGEAPSSCEAKGPNGMVSTAVPLDVSGGSALTMGWIDPAGESDWYAVELEKGHLLSVETRAHCQSALDTQLGVYGPGGTTQVASADDGDAGSWAALREHEVAQAGTHYIGLTAYAVSGAGAYILEVTAGFPPPCQSVADCECEELECMTEGPDAGKCVLTMAEEQEPNDTPQAASPSAVGSRVVGAFAGEADADWYVVALEAGVPVNVKTASYCGETTDPQVWIYGELGLTVLATDADGAGGGHALVESFTPAATGTYRIKVKDQAALSGAYVLSIEDARCKADSDCGCADQRCTGTAEAPGECVPKLTAKEPQTDAPVSIVLDKRVHSVIGEPYDVDKFVVSLAPGTYDFETMAYCGADNDTEMKVYAPGNVLAGEDEDSGEGFFAAVKGVVVTNAGAYLIEVSAYGPGVGEYLVRVKHSTGD